MGVLESRRCCPVPLARDTLKVSYTQSYYYNCLLVMPVQFNGMVHAAPVTTQLQPLSINICSTAGLSHPHPFAACIQLAKVYGSLSFIQLLDIACWLSHPHPFAFCIQPVKVNTSLQAGGRTELVEIRGGRGRGQRRLGYPIITCACHDRQISRLHA